MIAQRYNISLMILSFGQRNLFGKIQSNAILRTPNTVLRTWRNTYWKNFWKIVVKIMEGKMMVLTMIPEAESRKKCSWAAKQPVSKDGLSRKEVASEKIRKKPKCWYSTLWLFNVYPDSGSNRDALRHWCLRPARLPIPPSGPKRMDNEWMWMQRYNKKWK